MRHVNPTARTRIHPGGETAALRQRNPHIPIRPLIIIASHSSQCCRAPPQHPRIQTEPARQKRMLCRATLHATRVSHARPSRTTSAWTGADYTYLPKRTAPRAMRTATRRLFGLAAHGSLNPAPSAVLLAPCDDNDPRSPIAHPSQLRVYATLCTRRLAIFPHPQDRVETITKHQTSRFIQ